MTSRLKTATLLLPLLAIAGQAGASDYCARLTARLNQMPQLIGSSTSAHYKSESLYRLNRLEIAIRRDMRRLDCPTNSIIEFNGNEHECSDLGEELASVRGRIAEFKDLQPVLSQTVDDGSGLASAIVAELKRANCDMTGTQQDFEIIGGAANRNARAETISASPVSWTPEETAPASTDNQDLAAVLGDDADKEFGTPEAYGMIEIRPTDKADIESGRLASVTLPKLEGQDLLRPGSSIEGVKTTPPAGEKPTATASAEPQSTVPVRDYDPNDPKVRKVGPTFLADKDDGINLGASEPRSVLQ